jgi:hypothetical protein
VVLVILGFVIDLGSYAHGRVARFGRASTA